ncbi:RTA1 like protein-domain-containing protein [Mycena floridula]|nr:RTA1 like protein-domain-containing protein [Mycena floridula]
MSTPPEKVNIVLAALGYIPKRLPAAVFGTIFLIAGIPLLSNVVHARSWWGICLPIGVFGYGLGYYVRIILVSQQDSKPIFITSTVLISCFPATYLAFNYIVYGRLLMHSLGPRYSIIKPSIIGLVFIMSDVTTFIVQAGGAAMEIDVDHRKLGDTLFKIGVIAQSISFCVFLFFIVWTHVKVKRVGKASSKAAWWKILYTVYVSSFAIVLTAWLYVFDAVPLFVAIAVFIPWWPAKYLFEDTLIEQEYQLTSRLLPTH